MEATAPRPVTLTQETFWGAVVIITAVLAWGAIAIIGRGEDSKVLAVQISQQNSQLNQFQGQLTTLVTTAQKNSEDAVETRVKLQILGDRQIKLETNMADLWDRVMTAKPTKTK